MYDGDGMISGDWGLCPLQKTSSMETLLSILMETMKGGSGLMVNFMPKASAGGG